jgi:hypothetical protein
VSLQPFEPKPPDRPTDTTVIPYAAQALAHHAKGEVYADRGWE